MDTSPDTLQSLLTLVTQVKWLLVALLLATLIFGGICTAAVLRLIRVVRAASEQHELDVFRDQAEELLAADRLDELVAFAGKKLATHPRHTYGHWYMALGHFHQGKLHDAKREFERVRDLEPGWGPDYVDPYLEEVRLRLRSSGPRLVQE